MTYTVALWDRDGQMVLVDPALALTPLRGSHSDEGGPETAEIGIEGTAVALADCVRWLAYRVEIYNGLGTVVWQGFVEAVRLDEEARSWDISIERMRNRAAVAYTYTGADGGTVRATTSWTEDSDSVSRYGTREILLSATDVTTTQAEAYRARVLATSGKPTVSVELSSQTPKATLYCRGWWSTLDWTYYTNAAGREEHSAAQATEHPLGLGFTSSNVAFYNYSIHHRYGYFNEFVAGDQIRVSGSSNNEGSYTISEGTNISAVTYTASTITFDAEDDVRDNAAAGLSVFTADEPVYISNTTSNNGMAIWDTVGSNGKHNTVIVDFGGAVVNETPASTTLEQGNHIVVTTRRTKEDAGATVTIATYGQQIAQSVTNNSGSAWTIDKIGVMLRKVGSPVDSITVGLYSDSGGFPNTLLDSGTIAAADISDGLAWAWADLGNNYTFATGTTYWIVLSRGAAAHYANYYRVGLDEKLGYSSGSLKVHDGNAWQSRTPNADMCFRIWGAVDTATQVGAIATAEEQFLVGVDVQTTSGVATNQYRNGDATALEEIVSLLETGTSAGGRLTAKVDAARILQIAAQPSYSWPALYRQERDGRITHAGGADVEPGLDLSGRWVDLADVPGSVDAIANVSAMYAASCDWDYRNDRVILRPPDMSDPWDIGEVRPG